VEAGTFDELVARGGRFAELARAQLISERGDDGEDEAITAAAPSQSRSS
jgi:ATP-binding cassette subfamily B protein